MSSFCIDINRIRCKKSHHRLHHAWQVDLKDIPVATDWPCISDTWARQPVDGQAKQKHVASKGLWFEIALLVHRKKRRRRQHPEGFVLVASGHLFTPFFIAYLLRKVFQVFLKHLWRLLLVAWFSHYCSTKKWMSVIPKKFRVWNILLARVYYAVW